MPPFLQLGHYPNLSEINRVALEIRNSNHEGRNINPGEEKTGHTENHQETTFRVEYHSAPGQNDSLRTGGKS